MNASGLGSEVSEVLEDSSYPAKWRAFRMRRIVALTLLYGFVPACVALFLVSRMWLHQPFLSVAGMVGWAVAAGVAIWWTGEFRCPRCRRRYGALGHRRGVNFTYGLFDSVCSNCKLRKFERV